MKRLFAEYLGAFFLVFAGTGAVVVNEVSGGAIGHIGVAIVFGLVVFAMIQTFGDVSGAHLNPAVTIGFAVAGRFPWRDVAGYALAQSAGAFSASGLLKMLFPASVTLGATLPSGGVQQSFILEVVLTAILMLVILSVPAGLKGKRLMGGITIGAVIGLEAMFAGPISGASMNPVRSLAPAVASGHLEHLWLYPVATVSGALIGVLLCSGVRESGCCKRPC